MTESTRARTVRTLAAAFGTRDVEAMLGCVSEDLVWELNGVRAVVGEHAFGARMREDLATGRAEVTIEQLIDDGDTVVALHRGRFVPHGDEGAATSFVSAEVYTFTGDRIRHMRTYQPLG